jgi:hypothetical protein
MAHDTDFDFEYNDDGNWCLAWLIDRHDEHNASFAYVAQGGLVVTTDGFVPEGDTAGHYRARG